MELNPLLRRAVEHGASDMHLKVGLPPILRRDGALDPLEGSAILMDRDMDAVIELVGQALARRGSKPSSRPVTSTSPTRTRDLPRFRVNAFKQRGHTSFAFRVIPKNVPNFEMLGLPAGVRSAGRRASRARARDRRDRLGKDDNARRDDRSHQPVAEAAHRHDR